VPVPRGPFALAEEVIHWIPHAPDFVLPAISEKPAKNILRHLPLFARLDRSR
jgi:hypothetical protein